MYMISGIYSSAAPNAGRDSSRIICRGRSCPKEEVRKPVREGKICTFAGCGAFRSWESLFPQKITA
ncbi:hypothetical protein LEMLEM_LOCUS18322 [Lemmus lemmus]